ncbi:Aspartate aminotransferase [Roseivivax jejudonensis]|uniref:aspartate transaminase n=1 Tax=Roseivivax jejudonensis TaxID=1529041 RepID=A0A1X6Z084_9RHOB|nr:aminotransferase [Roseivivax jejudonensis]SLN36602.1 Aspartate aminotransferase [Roseivivax jejudonensis]
MPSRTEATFAPPVMEARRWLAEATLPPTLPLLNVSQAAPVAPPPEALRDAMARALAAPETHLYGPVLGRPELRAALAADWARHYGGPVAADEVAITAGCNQAFAATIAALTTEGDEVVVPVPWYFNHKMWLDMAGVRAVSLATGPDLLPSADAARALVGPRTRAIALVSPNNPAGVEYPAATLRAFRDLAAAAGITLIVDETYRDFDSRAGAPHDLRAGGPDPHLVQLYSFSKAYRLTGHRVGAIVGPPSLMPEVEKFLDTVAICAPQLGQIAAAHGLAHLGDWVAGERAEILGRRAAIEAQMPALAAKGWQCLGLGAYFAYLAHPFAEPSDTLARALVSDAGILCLPGTMFRAADDPLGARELRIAFANIDADGIATLFGRLAALDRPLASRAARA